MKNQRHVIMALVEDRPGVLQRISCLFRKRNFNIDTITVGKSEIDGISRMTITLKADERTLNQVIKQLEKLIDVIRVEELHTENIVERELALIKIKTSNIQERDEVIQYANIFRAKIVDVSKNSLIIEITGTPDKIDAFINLVKNKILELARTGIVAMKRGNNETSS